MGERARRDNCKKRVPTFRELIADEYLIHATVTLKSGHSLKVRVSQCTVLTDFFGELRLDQIGPREVDEYKAVRVAAGLRNVSVNNDLRALGTILRFAERRGYPVQPRKWTYLPKRCARRARAWSVAEIGRLFDALDRTAPELLPLVHFLINTGCRKGEALALRWDNVFLDVAVPFVRIEPDAESGWSPKDEEPREIGLSRSVVDMLRVQKQRARSRWVFVTHRRGEPRRYAFWPQRAFDRARRAAGLSGGPHHTRHTFASQYVAKGGDIRDLQPILGHASVRTTEGYVHRLPEHVARGANVVDIAPTRAA